MPGAVQMEGEGVGMGGGGGFSFHSHSSIKQGPPAEPSSCKGH